MNDFFPIFYHWLWVIFRQESGGPSILWLIVSVFHLWSQHLQNSTHLGCDSLRVISLVVHKWITFYIWNIRRLVSGKIRVLWIHNVCRIMPLALWPCFRFFIPQIRNTCDIRWWWVVRRVIWIFIRQQTPEVWYRHQKHSSHCMTGTSYCGNKEYQKNSTLVRTDNSDLYEDVVVTHFHRVLNRLLVSFQKLISGFDKFSFVRFLLIAD